MPYTYDVPFDVAFRKVNDWSVNNGYPSGWPTFEQRTVGGAREYNIALIRPNTDAVYWRDVQASAMGNPDPRDHRVRLTKAHDYALARGAVHGYPNIHQQIYPGSGLVYGTFLVNPGYADYREPTSRELGLGSDPRTQPLDAWFRSVHQYAVRIGYATGKPNGHWGLENNEWELGVHCFRSDYVTTTWRSGSSLGYPSPPSEPPSGWASITFTRPYPSDPFYYRARGLLVGVPTSGWKITHITNTAQDTYNNVNIPLDITFDPIDDPNNDTTYFAPNETKAWPSA